MKKKNELVIGRFYKVYGGPSHPSLVYFYDKNHKTYLSLRFGTSKGRHMTEIHPIQIGYQNSYIHNRPFEGTRDDYGDKELQGLSIDSRDLNVIETVKSKKPERSKRARKRHGK